MFKIQESSYTELFHSLTFYDATVERSSHYNKWCL